MFSNERKQGNTIFRHAVVTSALVLASGMILAGEIAPPAYSMAVVKDVASGQLLLSGQYSKGIATISSYGKSRAGSFAAKNNLCVAYTLTKKFDKAESACEAAVTIGQRYIRHSMGPINAQRSRDLALAYSNRGVLRAVSGESALAMQDFELASEVHSNFKAAGENLARLKSKEQTAMSSL